MDLSIKMLREMYLKGIESVKAGKDPVGVVRDEKENEMIVIGGLYRWVSEDEYKKMKKTAA